MNFCPNCGTKLNDDLNNSIKRCPKCDYIDWNNWVNVVCITVAKDSLGRVLMIELKGKEEGKITFPGGFREIGETLEEAAKREYLEETGMIIKNLNLYKILTDDFRRLVWVVFKADLILSDFIANDEVKRVFLVEKLDDINFNLIRGYLTKVLCYEIFDK